MHYHCIVLVIAHHDNGGFSDQFKDLWVSHWNMSHSTKTVDMQIFYLYNGSKSPMVSGNDLYFPFDENIPGLIKKTLAAFQYIHDQGITYDYIFRTNLSSCIDWPKFTTFLKSLIHQNNQNSNNSGFGGSYYQHKGINHASGSGYFISHSLVQTILHNKCKVLHMARDYHDYPEDDVIINKYLQNEHKIVPFYMHRTDITSQWYLSYLSFQWYLQGVFNFGSSDNSDNSGNSGNNPSACFHYRFKTHDRLNDVARMKVLIDLLQHDHNQQMSNVQIVPIVPISIVTLIIVGLLFSFGSVTW